MFSAAFCAEKVLSYGLSSIVWLLQKLFGRVFDPEPDLGLLSVQLASGRAVFQDLCFSKEFIDSWLIPYGFECVSGTISKLELCLKELSTLSLSAEFDILHLKLRQTNKDEKTTELSLEATETQADGLANGFHSWIKMLLDPMVVTIAEMKIEVENEGSLSFTGLSFTQKPDWMLQFEKLRFSLAAAPTIDDLDELLCLAGVSMVLDMTNAENGHSAKCQVSQLKGHWNPKIIKRFQELILKLSCGSEEHVEVFDDAQSSFYSINDTDTNSILSGSESVFYDCQEEFAESVSSCSRSESKFTAVFEKWMSIKLKLSIKIHQTEIWFSENVDIKSKPHFLLTLEEMDFVGRLDHVQEMEVSFKNVLLMEENGSKRTTLQRHDGQRFEISETFRSLLDDNICDGSYVKFGFSEIQEPSCLQIKCKKARDFPENKISCHVSSSPIVFWTTCSALHRIQSLVRDMRFMCSDSISVEVSSSSVEASWRIDGIYGILESVHSESLFFGEFKTGNSGRLISTKKAPDLQKLRLLENLKCQLTQLNIAEMTLYHCFIQNNRLGTYRQIYSCNPIKSTPSMDSMAPEFELQSGFHAEIALYGHPGPPVCELSSLAYQLVHQYSVDDNDDQDNGNYSQDKMLARVEYEGRCMQTAECLVELRLEDIRVDLINAELEMMSDIFFEFWHPAQMSDEMKKKEPPQINLLINCLNLSGRFRSSEKQQSLDSSGLELSMHGLNAFIVSGLQNQTITTIALDVQSFELQSLEQQNIFRMGHEEASDHFSSAIEKPALEIFQISELDYRNAKFKQWGAGDQRNVCVCLSSRFWEFAWIVKSFTSFFKKNETKLQTDIEVETSFSLTNKRVQLFYKLCEAENKEMELCLGGMIDQIKWTLKDLKTVTSKAGKVQMLLREDPESFTDFDADLAESGFHLFACEEMCSLTLKSTKESELELEIKNDAFSADLNPERTAKLVRMAQSLKASDFNHFSSHSNSNDAKNVPVSTPMMSSGMDEIVHDAFTCPSTSVPHRRNSEMQDEASKQEKALDEEYEGFVCVNYPNSVHENVGQRSESGSPTGKNLKSSQVFWLDDMPVRIKDDYVFRPDSHRFREEEDALPRKASCLKLPSGYPLAKFTIRVDEVKGQCIMQGEDPMDHIDINFDGLCLVYYLFSRGGNYRDRLAAVVQDFEIVDYRLMSDIQTTRNDQKKVIVERNRAKLKTKSSQKLKQVQRMTCPMIEVKLETVLPDLTHFSTMNEKRVSVSMVPLRLRFSQTLLEFLNMYRNTLPQKSEDAGLSCYFQMCEISPLYVVVDYKPSPFNLDRLKEGHTSEILNIIQWGGLEFILKEIKISGVAGGGVLLSQILRSWRQDITAAQGHHLVSGLPSLGIIKRMSPAAQEVIKSSISKFFKKEAPVVNDRGFTTHSTQPISRSARVFGKAVLLEALNAGAHATESIHSVLNEPQEPPSNPISGIRKARHALKDAAKSLFMEPVESVRMGQSVSTAMYNATKAAPRALLSPLSALNSIAHGALRGACDALDTDHVLDA